MLTETLNLSSLDENIDQLEKSNGKFLLRYAVDILFVVGQSPNKIQNLIIENTGTIVFVDTGLYDLTTLEVRSGSLIKGKLLDAPKRVTIRSFGDIVLSFSYTVEPMESETDRILLIRSDNVKLDLDETTFEKIMVKADNLVHIRGEAFLGNIQVDSDSTILDNFSCGESASVLTRSREVVIKGRADRIAVQGATATKLYDPTIINAVRFLDTNEESRLILVSGNETRIRKLNKEDFETPLITSDNRRLSILDGGPDILNLTTSDLLQELQSIAQDGDKSRLKSGDLYNFGLTKETYELIKGEGNE